MTQPIEQQRQPKSEYPNIELGKPEDYRYVSQAEVAAALEAFGYGPSMRRVHALYLNQDGSQAVGVWLASQEEGHFIGNPVLRGVEQAEAIGQTLLLALHFTGKIPPEMTPRLRLINIEYRDGAIPPVGLNTVVQLGNPESPHQLIGFGQVRCGDTILTQGYVGGTLLPQTLGEKMLARIKRRQANAVTRFPLQG